MTTEAKSAEAVEAKKKPKLVKVTIGVTDGDGNNQSLEKKIPAGKTEVPILKNELELPAASSLWFVPKNGKRKVLADHEHHTVKADDHFEAVVKGGIS